MIICWDNLEGIKLTKNGVFLKNGRSSFVYRNACKNCNEPYLTVKHAPSDFCSKSCSHKGNKPWLGKTHSQKTKTKMSKSAIKRSQDEEYSLKLSLAQTGSKNHNWRGGVSKKNVPLFDTYKESLWPEEVKFSIVEQLKLLNVKCTRCSKWFVPTTDEVQRRLKHLNNIITAEGRFYCSTECKHSCSIYGQIKYPKNFTAEEDKVYTKAELNVWAKEVLKRHNSCEFCGATATIAHHIKPKKLYPHEALDVDNGIACCEKCHFTYGHQDECSTGNLSHKICK